MAHPLGFGNAVGVQSDTVQMLDGHGEPLRQRRVTEIVAPRLGLRPGQQAGGIQSHGHDRPPHNVNNSSSVLRTLAADAAPNSRPAIVA